MPGIDLTAIAKVVEGLLLQDTVRISQPGASAPVFDPATGEYTTPVPEVFYEGRGAVQVAGTPGGVSSTPIPNQPWVDETQSRYRLFTPLDVPVAERDMLVEVITVHPGGDLGLLGRRWRAQDPGIVGTLSAVRITGLDQMQQDGEGST